MKFIENKQVSLDNDTGVVIMASTNGDLAIIEWQSDGNREEWDANTFFIKGNGLIIN